MAEILGVGLTHSPSLIAPDELKNYSLTRALQSNDRIPIESKNPESWPDAMRTEWGEDEGYTSALYQREKLVNGFRRLRSEIDTFNPDVVLVWGDDQYENFKEDIIPA
ncbi:MAG: extradiol ring-cleavage dioxygenase, partial [Dehalococcoidia bacterium]|nr:extradiol ring-cleavage dioxygenase [Dehalococcoidia bacterium]